MDIAGGAPPIRRLSPQSKRWLPAKNYCCRLFLQVPYTTHRKKIFKTNSIDLPSGVMTGLHLFECTQLEVLISCIEEQQEC